MRNTTNLKLRLYDSDDLINITGPTNSLNHNMEIIDEAINNTQKEVTTQSNRIDNLILNSGDSSTEVIDARVDVDGKTYSTLKERLDTENSELKSDLNALVAIDGSDFIYNGYIQPNGAFISNAGYIATGYIPLTQEGVFVPIAYHLRMFRNTVIGLYDENKNYVNSIIPSDTSDLTTVSGILDAPQGAVYARFCTASELTDYHIKYATVKNKVGGKAITTDKIADKAITTGKVGYKAITAEKVAFISHDELTNYINRNELEQGYINSNGEVINDNYLYCTNFIELKEGVNYYYGSIQSTYYAFYDENYALVASYSTLGTLISPFTIPTGAKFGRFTMHRSGVSNAWIYTENGKPNDYGFILDSNVMLTEKYCDYKGRDVSAFSKCICIGDSLTEGTFNYREGDSTGNYVNYTKYSYPTYFQKLTNIETTNKGHSGASTTQWWAMEENSDLSGYDMAIIQLGVNDYAVGQTEWSADSKTAMTNIINKLISENTNIKIFVANIINATSYDGRDYISDGIERLVAELANPNVIFLDMAQYSHVGDRTDYNCGHLSAYGYWRLAQDYANYISYIMATDSSDVFREIQFIGTNYQYHA